MSLNRVCVMGRLTRDPELRRTQNGTAVTSFSLAVEDDHKDKQTGEKRVYFLDFVAWSHTAEFVCKYFSKGRMAVVDGHLRTRTWTDDDGRSRKAVEIVADSVHFGSSKRDEGKDSAPAENAAYATTGGFTAVEDDGELPF